MFLATVQPSHQSVVAGVDPPPTVIGSPSVVVFTTVGVDCSGSIKGPILDPHIFIIATLPAFHSAEVAFES